MTHIIKLLIQVLNVTLQTQYYFDIFNHLIDFTEILSLYRFPDTGYPRLPRECRTEGPDVCPPMGSKGDPAIWGKP